MDIAYFGYSEELILRLIEHEAYGLKLVVTQEGRLSDPTLKLLSVLGVPYRFVGGKKDILALEEQLREVDAVLIYLFGVIVPRQIYENIPCFNIHPGDPAENRGPYPLVWDVLLDRKKSVSVLHRLGDTIDTGEVLSRYEVDIDEGDDPRSIGKKLDAGLPVHLESLLRYDPSAGYPVISDGVYRKMVTPEDITIREQDTLEDIDRKIRCQSRYGGALLRHGEYVFRVSEVKKV